MLLEAVAVLMLHGSACDASTFDDKVPHATRTFAVQSSSNKDQGRNSNAALRTKRSTLSDTETGRLSPGMLGKYDAGNSTVSAAPSRPVFRAYPTLVAPPKPQAEALHAFTDRRNTIGFAVHGAVRVADAAQTCVLLDRPGHREVWLPTQSCKGIVAYSLSMIPAQIGTSYLLHRRGHHKLERWMPYIWAAPSAIGVGVSLRAW